MNFEKVCAAKIKVNKEKAWALCEEKGGDRMRRSEPEHIYPVYKRIGNREAEKEVGSRVQVRARLSVASDRQQRRV